MSTQWIDPDCSAGKHSACMGGTAELDCNCVCHMTNPVAIVSRRPGYHQFDSRSSLPDWLM